MSSSVRISLRSARVLLDTWPKDWLDERSTVGRAFVELRDAMKPRKSAAPARKRRVAKKATKRRTTSEIRDAVFARAGGVCECGCLQAFEWSDLGELDHFFPKGRTPQSERTCWALLRRHHFLKTDNIPDAETWLEKFIDHAEKHGFAAEAAVARGRLESLSLQAEAEARHG